MSAPPARVYRAARTVDLGAAPLVRTLMALRALPALVMQGLRGRPARQALSPVFTVVAERPGEEIVLGIMGRFWTPTGGVVAAEPARFRAAPPRGVAQGFWNLRVEPTAGGTLLSTETRVRCGDPDTRRRFLRYWRVIRPGSGLIRSSLLRRIKARAEHATD